VALAGKPSRVVMLSGSAKKARQARLLPSSRKRRFSRDGSATVSPWSDRFYPVDHQRRRDEPTSQGKGASCQQFGGLLRRHRPAEQEALHLVAAVLAHERELFAGLDALGHDGQPQLVAEGDHRLRAPPDDAGHEGAVSYT